MINPSGNGIGESQVLANALQYASEGDPIHGKIISVSDFPVDRYRSKPFVLPNIFRHESSRQRCRSGRILLVLFLIAGLVGMHSFGNQKAFDAFQQPAFVCCLHVRTSDHLEDWRNVGATR